MSNVHGMIRSAYTFDSDAVSNETALDTGEDAVTQQCFKDECDIDRKSTRLNSSHSAKSRMPSSA